MTFLATLIARYTVGRWLQANWAWVKYILIAGFVVVAFLAYRSSLIEHGRELERAEWKARQQAAQAKAQADSWEIVGKFGEIDTSVATIHQETAKAEIIYVPKIIRTAVEFYRDNPVCRPPDRLWRTNDEYAAELARSAGISTSPLRGDKDAGQ